MVAISSTYGVGGQDLTPGGGSGSSGNSLAEALRDIADDLTELRTELLVAGAVFTDLTALKTQLAKANSIYTDLTAIKTQLTKANKIYTDLNALRGAITAITAKLDLDASVASNTYASVCDPAALQVTVDLTTVTLGTASNPTTVTLTTTANPAPAALNTSKA